MKLKRFAAKAKEKGKDRCPGAGSGTCHLTCDSKEGHYCPYKSEKYY